VAYLKPALFAKRVFNPIALRFGLGGAEGLVVRGRTTRQPQRVPVIPVEHEGERYLVSTRGESEWVRNIRDAAGGEIDGKSFRAVEIPVEQREPIIAAYREVAGRSVTGYWKKLPDPADHPVFRIDVGSR
jgi:hypothetical protein